MDTRYFDYSTFDSELPQPLHGYVYRLKNGHVPVWLLPPVVSRNTLRRWLNSAPEHTVTGDRAGLPDGISAVPYHSRTQETDGKALEFEIEPDRYFKIKRAVAAEISEPHIHIPLAITDSRRNQFREGRQRTIPDKIKRRLEAITETPAWEEKCQMRDFKRWVLTYDLDIEQSKSGNPPHIESVAIESQFR